MMERKKLHIKQIELFRSPFKLKEPFIISLGTLYCAENILLRIKTSEGFTGFGECSPFPSINGETADTCLVIGRKIAEILIGKNPLDTDACHELMDCVIFGNNSIKSAFDIAMFDISSQNAVVPLWQFLGGNKVKKIVTDYTVSIGTPEKMADDALKIKKKGFGIIKVKLGRNGKTDIDRIAAVREAVGKEILIRIDANQGWHKDEAIETLLLLSAFGIQFCEEPVPRWSYTDLPEIRRRSPVKIMADESCFDHHDAERLIGLSACDYLNIKLGKSSGIAGALKIIRMAEAKGIKMQIGGFLESRLGFTASAHLALSSVNIAFFDLDSPLMLEEDPVIGGIRYDPGGLVVVPGSPGLGASVNEDFLKKLERISVS